MGNFRGCVRGCLSVCVCLSLTLSFWPSYSPWRSPAKQSSKKHVCMQSRKQFGGRRVVTCLISYKWRIFVRTFKKKLGSFLSLEPKDLIYLFPN